VIVEGAIDMVKRHSFEPSFYYRPDHVEIQLSYLAYMAYAHLFHSISHVNTVQTSRFPPVAGESVSMARTA